MTRRAAVVGILMLGGCVAANPSFVESTTEGDTSAGTATSASSEGPGSTTDVAITSGEPGFCGDGVVDPDEQCDDGDDDPFNECSNECSYTGCGDGVVQAGEACDDGNFDDDDECLDTCELARCGDGKVWLGVEECDAGDGNNSDEGACLGDCTRARCGDGLLQVGVEGCDDGNNVNTDECLNSCELASCGDGVLFVGVEACDDGNDAPDDGCDACAIPPPPYRMIFVSSEVFTGAMGGLAGADAACQDLATKAGLQGQFLAWLGDAQAWPASRMSKADVPYLRTDFVPVAKNWADLTDGILQAPLDKMENAMQAPNPPGFCNGVQPVHSNIVKDGTPYDAPGDCGDWTTDVGMTRAGQLGAVNSAWTDGCMMGCVNKAPIYCVQQ